MGTKVFLQPFTHVRMPTVIVVVMSAQKREITILIGIPLHGGILPFLLIMLLNVKCIIKIRVTIECPEECVKRYIMVIHQSIGQFTTMNKNAQTITVSCCCHIFHPNHFAFHYLARYMGTIVCLSGY